MSIPCELSGYCERGLDHDGPCGPATRPSGVVHRALFTQAMEERNEARARVAELEAQHRESSDAILAEVRARREAGVVTTQREFVILDARKRIAELEASLASANADRARLAAALSGMLLRDTMSCDCDAPELGPCEWHSLSSAAHAALASSDAAAWLHERDMRVAEEVQRAASEIYPESEALLDMDLAAVVAGVK